MVHIYEPYSETSDSSIVNQTIVGLLKRPLSDCDYDLNHLP